MNLQELKNTVAAIESAEKNIESWNDLRGRELVIIPADSEYYKDFEKWKKGKEVYFDGKKENPPMYISPCRASVILDVIVKGHEEFANHNKEKISFLLDKKEIPKRPEFPVDRV
jgi:hypothetical protein